MHFMFRNIYLYCLFDRSQNNKENKVHRRDGSYFSQVLYVARDLPASSKFVFGQSRPGIRELKRGGQRNNQYPAPLSPPCAMLDGWGVKGRCCLSLLGPSALSHRTLVDVSTNSRK